MKKLIIAAIVSFSVLVNAKDLKIIVSTDKKEVWLVDKDKVLSVSPYKYYFGSWGRETEVQKEESWMKDEYRIHFGAKIQFESEDKSVNIASGGSGIISGGNANIENNKSFLILRGVTSSEVIEQLYKK